MVVYTRPFSKHQRENNYLLGKKGNSDTETHDTKKPNDKQKNGLFAKILKHFFKKNFLF